MTAIQSAWLAIGLLTATSVMLLLNRNWRWSIMVLAAQYAGVTLLVALAWPVEMAITKVVTGWMAGAVLGVAMISISRDRRAVAEAAQAERFWPSGRLFRMLAALLVGLVVASATPDAVNWIPGISLEEAWGGLILIGMGLLHLGLTAQPFRITLGLLTVLSGFEIFYARVESSALVASLLAGVQLGLAFVGAYMLVVPTLESSE